ncbi:MAG: hypothetical protein JWN70_1364, partial [Planctomycetaceae bacterium]|nr:hypothetical protein [Planctomycetaceae bacterium]
GNKPIRDPGWPKGAAVIFNHPSRVAWWEGPKLDGKRHAEYAGDAKVLNAVLADFAKMEVKVKRVVIHDGAGQSVWLGARNPTKIDWSFEVWDTRSWERIYKRPGAFNPNSNGLSPESQIDVYTANILWADVVVPAGIEVRDSRTR